MVGGSSGKRMSYRKTKFRGGKDRGETKFLGLATEI